MNEAMQTPENSAATSPVKAPNTLAWIGAFAPIWSELLARLIFANVQLGKNFQEQIGTYELLVIVICNLIVFVLDDFILKKKKIGTKTLEKCCFIFPYYLWVRGTLNKDNRAYFICWCISFGIMWAISFALDVAKMVA